VIEMANRYGVPVIPGAMTPTEILMAWEAGADMVIPLAPTGGITADNAGEFIRAGVAIVCAGGWLVDKKAVAEGRYEVLTENARRLVEAVRKAREA